MNRFLGENSDNTILFKLFIQYIEKNTSEFWSRFRITAHNNYKYVETLLSFIIQCKLKYLLDKCQVKFFILHQLDVHIFIYSYTNIFFNFGYFSLLCAFFKLFCSQNHFNILPFCKTLCKVFKKNIDNKNKVFFLINNSIYAAISKRTNSLIYLEWK